MVANQKIIAAINEQIGNEFSAMLQYYAIAAYFDAEALLELSAHFHKQAEEEKKHALRFIQHRHRCPGERTRSVRSRGALQSR